MYDDNLVYNVVIWVFFEISLWKENEAINGYYINPNTTNYLIFKMQDFRNG